MINWEELKENNTLEDFYNILCRNKPHKNSKMYSTWNYLESTAYEELLNEEEHPSECERIINEIIEFLKEQRKNDTTACLEEKEERICSECNKPMDKGYCIDNGLEYYCSDECLRKHYTNEEYNEMYDDGNGDSYYTEWED